MYWWQFGANQASQQTCLPQKRQGRFTALFGKVIVVGPLPIPGLGYTFHYIPCLIISTVAAFSWKCGKRASIHIVSDRAAWNADHITGVPYSESLTAVIHACSCCCSSCNDLFATGCSSFIGGWVTRLRPTCGTRTRQDGSNTACSCFPYVYL